MARLSDIIALAPLFFIIACCFVVTIDDFCVFPKDINGNFKGITLLIILLIIMYFCFFKLC